MFTFPGSAFSCCSFSPDVKNEILHKRFISILIQLNTKKVFLLTWQTIPLTFKYVYLKGLEKFWSILILAHEQVCESNEVILVLIVYFMICYTFGSKANSALHVYLP